MIKNIVRIILLLLLSPIYIPLFLIYELILILGATVCILEFIGYFIPFISEFIFCGKFNYELFRETIKDNNFLFKLLYYPPKRLIEVLIDSFKKKDKNG